MEPHLILKNVNTAYENGEPISSLNFTTADFLYKECTYYVRCYITEIGGDSIELISNPVSTIGKSVLFKYEGKSSIVCLPKGKYKLEVWGAQGGSSIGTRNDQKTSNGNGGLGGYSKGVLTLKEREMIYIFVGGKGSSANPLDGAVTEGGFPDGGNTKTGHCEKATCVPGTGGGSTSIRISNDSIYSRIIVAGGGSGASGDSYNTNHGGFGGGFNGGNCYYGGKMIEQGSGTKVNSTNGKGYCGEGFAGVFGHGASRNYLSGRDTGGGGGGGWYGGGSGGYGGNNACSGGGGGSGWIFTESCFNTWMSGKKDGIDNLLLNKSYYLTDAVCVPGDEEFTNPNGNGKEKGHSGDGYAKITPQ